MEFENLLLKHIKNEEILVRGYRVGVIYVNFHALPCSLKEYIIIFTISLKNEEANSRADEFLAHLS